MKYILNRYLILFSIFMILFITYKEYFLFDLFIIIMLISQLNHYIAIKQLQSPIIDKMPAVPVYKFFFWGPCLA